MRTISILAAIATLAVAGCQSSNEGDPAAGSSTALAAAASAEPRTTAATIPDNIRRAVESQERSAEHRARDVNRKPAEVLALAEIEDGGRVIEIAGFGQYFTTLLTAAVGPSGMVDVYDLPYTEQFAGEASRAFDAAHDNMVYHQESYNDASLPQGVDAVLSVLYYHDLRPAGVDTAAFNRKIFEALKPGGIYLVIDHKAEDGSGWRDADTVHRMDVAIIRSEVPAAGFELVTESDLLANPQDDRTKMVFADGTRGRTDQALFVFRKPN